MKHFGINLVKRKYSFNLNREEFALIDTKPSLPKFEDLALENAYTDDNATEYTLEWCEKYRKVCLENYDLSMKYFENLDQTKFTNSITLFLEENKDFKKVEDLTKYKGVKGFYMLVLDKYKQVYIGKTCDIKKRIQEHWTRTKKFDRILFPMYAKNTSTFSIDFFRALDTTRIYVSEKILSIGIEGELIRNFPKEYLTNRIGGDITNINAIEVISSMNIRELSEE